MSNPAEGNGRAAHRPPPLLIQWVGPPPSPERPFGLLRLALGPEVCCYFIEPVPSDFGRAFAVYVMIYTAGRGWIEATRGLSGRQPRRYPTVEAAYARMQEENKHLTPDQARHLTQHGVNQNEDGTYSWKFDHYVRLWPPYDMSRETIAGLWGAITCPTLLVYGKESWAKDPREDGRAAFFRNARVLGVEGAGHWVHHDRLNLFVQEVRGFLAELKA